MKITESKWMFLDTETTGLYPSQGAKVIELGWWCVGKGLRPISGNNKMIDPGEDLSPLTTKLTGIKTSDVKGQRDFKGNIDEFLEYFKSCDFIAAYNAKFDREMLEAEFKRAGISLPKKIWLDPLVWCRAYMNPTMPEPGEEVPNASLGQAARHFEVELKNAHRAQADARAAMEIMIKMWEFYHKEANWPDDVEEMKRLEDGWASGKSRMQVLQKNLSGLTKRSSDGKQIYTPKGTTPEEEKYLANKFNENKIAAEDYLRKVQLEKWSRRK